MAIYCAKCGKEILDWHYFMENERRVHAECRDTHIWKRIDALEKKVQELQELMLEARILTSIG